MPKAKARYAGGYGSIYPFLSSLTTGYTAPFPLANRLSSKELMSWPAVPRSVVVPNASSYSLTYDHEQTVCRHQETRMEPSRVQNFISDQSVVSQTLISLSHCLFDSTCRRLHCERDLSSLAKKSRFGPHDIVWKFFSMLMMIPMRSWPISRTRRRPARSTK